MKGMTAAAGDYAASRRSPRRRPLNAADILRPDLALKLHRDRVAQLIDSIEALTDKMAQFDPLPLDLLDRYERVLTAAHAANLLRVEQFSDDELLRRSGFTR